MEVILTFYVFLSGNIRAGIYLRMMFSTLAGSVR